MFASLFRRKPREDASALFGVLISEARSVAPFRDFGVADTFEGRFEHLALVTTLVLERLAALGGVAQPLAQELVDAVFKHLDDALRRSGVTDLGVGKKVKKLAKSFYGRINAYTAGLEAGEASLRDALSRNLYGSAVSPEAVPQGMLERIAALRAVLGATSLADLKAGNWNTTGE
jgi:cytochrome b pre-mRNA-processing protein 3